MINNGKAIKDSLFKDALVASPGRKILAFLLDFFLNLVFALLFFALLDLSSNAFPQYKSLQRETTAAQANLYQLIYDSKLNKKTQTSSFMTEEELAKETIYGLVLSSNEDKTIKDDLHYQGYFEYNKDNDGLFYYYTNYKKEHQSDFESKALTPDGYLNAIYPNSKEYFSLVDDYPLLTKEAASSLDNYIRDGYEPGQEIYNKINSDYLASHKKAMEDLETSKSYKDELNKFTVGKDSILQIRGSFLIVGYILSIILSYLILPIFFKNGKSVGYKVLSLAYVTYSGEEPKVLSQIIKFFIFLFEEFGMNLIAVFLLFGAEGRFFLSLNIWGFINILYASLFSYLLLIISLILMLIKKENHQSLAEIASLLITKDTRDFKLSSLKEGDHNGR